MTPSTFLPAADRLAAASCPRTFWRFPERVEALADIMAVEARREPEKAAARAVTEFALQVGEMAAAAELRRAA